MFPQTLLSTKYHHKEYYFIVYFKKKKSFLTILRKKTNQKKKRQKHELPALIDYTVEGGCAPAVSSRQLDFHYNKHHKTYVDKLNTLLAGTAFEGQPLDKVIQRTAYNAEHASIFNNAAQHWNHSFYWRCMTPGGTALPEEIRMGIEKKWGTVDKFRNEVCFFRAHSFFFYQMRGVEAKKKKDFF